MQKNYPVRDSQKKTVLKGGGKEGSYDRNYREEHNLITLSQRRQDQAGHQETIVREWNRQGISNEETFPRQLKETFP